MAPPSIQPRLAQGETLFSCATRTSVPYDPERTHSTIFRRHPIGSGTGVAPFILGRALRGFRWNVKIELGRSRMLVEDVLKLSEGSVVELDKLAGDPVDVFVNDRLVARGEVLVLNDNFCVRVNEIVAGVKEEGL